MPDEPKPQPDKFRDLARELECDEDEAKFEETVKRVAEKPKAPEPKRD
jgi:hypothetical protein